VTQVLVCQEPDPVGLGKEIPHEVWYSLDILWDDVGGVEFPEMHCNHDFHILTCTVCEFEFEQTRLVHMDHKESLATGLFFL